MGYVMLITAVLGILSTIFIGLPSPNTYQGERFFYQTVVILTTITLLLAEGLIWVLSRI